MSGERIDTCSSVEEKAITGVNIENELITPPIVITKKTPKMANQCLIKVNEGGEKFPSPCISQANLLNEDIKTLEDMNDMKKEIINISTTESPISIKRPPTSRFPFRNMMLSKENLRIKRNFDMQVFHKKPRPRTARFKRKVPKNTKCCTIFPTAKKSPDDFERYVMKLKRRKERKKMINARDKTKATDTNTELTWINISSKTRNTILPFAYDQKKRVSMSRPQTAFRRGSCETIYRDQVKRAVQLKTLSSHNTTKNIGDTLRDFYLSTQNNPRKSRRTKKKSKKQNLVKIKDSCAIGKAPFLSNLHPKMKQAPKTTKLKKILT
ncbi:unnamed protein product [Moneuplotes crassus]|uniref:Uncharacterized protein n=1 Tax=Euplotes crassus TaxID=5936 RepID=A0AAD1UNU7_EUPCR|nr:unnamed protein product [Moneuplotes crassus]